jgi:hypothetical protein
VKQQAAAVEAMGRCYERHEDIIGAFFDQRAANG